MFVKIGIRVTFLFGFLLNHVNCNNGYYDVSNWKYHFPSGAGMGIYTALAIGVPDSPNIDLFLAVFFEAYYALPFNDTSFEFPPDVSDRSIRKSLYDSMANKLNSKGYPGKTCVLKTICEAASYSVRHFNGLVGDLLYVLLTPSSSKNLKEDHLMDYREAEKIGETTQNCENYNTCSVSLLDLMSFIK